jgi:AraC family transcriptional regulator
MSEYNLYIKNMVCDRCIRTVRDELTKLGMDVKDVQLGIVRLGQAPSEKQQDEAEKVLRENGFELLRNKHTVLAEKIKAAVVTLVHYTEESLAKENLSEYLSHKFDLSYKHLSSLFSEHENMTIEKYYIYQKIERAKELLEYGEMNLSEIAYKLGYSSVQHFSTQFKKITGITPSQYTRQSDIGRVPLDSI